MPKKKKRSPGPCPDPEKYILVRTKEGDFWRRKRGTLKYARLNASFRKNVMSNKVASPAAKRVIQELRPFLRDLQTGRLQVRLTGAFIKAITEKGRPDFSFLKEFDFHEHKLSALLSNGWYVEKDGDTVKIDIPVTPGAVKQYNRAVTDYYFEAILLYGDVRKSDALHIESTISRLYSFSDSDEEDCILTLSLPVGKHPWMVILKASCLEKDQMARHEKGYGMRVVEVG